MPWPEVSDYTSDFESVTKWIFSTLSNIPEVTDLVGYNSEFDNVPEIYSESPKKGATVPYCVFNFMGSKPTTKNGGRKIFGHCIVNISLITSGESFAGLWKAFGKISNAMQNDQLNDHPTICGSRVLSETPSDIILDGGIKGKVLILSVQITVNDMTHAGI